MVYKILIIVLLAHVHFACAYSSDEHDTHDTLHVRERRSIKNFTAHPLRKWQTDSPIGYYFTTDGMKSTNQWNDKNRRNAKEALQMFEDVTCLSFAYDNTSLRNSEPKRLRIHSTKNNQCASSGVGSETRSFDHRVPMSPSPWCTKAFTHELGHSLGLYHEFRRHDREQHVKYRSSNPTQTSIDSGETFDFPYDLGSVMSYPHHKDIIVDQTRRLVPYTNVRPSFGDAALLNAAYCAPNCTKAEEAAHPCHYGGYLRGNDCKTCACPTGLDGKHCNKVQKSEAGNKVCGTLKASNKWQTKVVKLDEAGYECYNKIDSDKNTLVEVQVRLHDKLVTNGQCYNYIEVKTDQWQIAGPRMCNNKDMPINRVRSVTNMALVMHLIQNPEILPSSSYYTFKYRQVPNDSAAIKPMTRSTSKRVAGGSVEEEEKPIKNEVRGKKMRCGYSDGWTFASYFCDGEKDCPGGEDEIDCPVTEAPPVTVTTKAPILPCATIPVRDGGLMAVLRSFQCKSTGTCLKASWECDGEVDCDDGSDEANCPQ